MDRSSAAIAAMTASPVAIRLTTSSSGPEKMCSVDLASDASAATVRSKTFGMVGNHAGYSAWLL